MFQWLQGLAPHHDDVEIFVCQTEGTKKWQIYAPHNQYNLPPTSSRDFNPDEIGAPLMEVTLEVGSPVENILPIILT